MDKKAIAWVLIGVAVVAAAYYLFTKSKSAAATAALGAGVPDNRGVWAAEDDALYQKFRSMFVTKDLNWIDPLVTQAYNTSAYGGGVACNDDVKIKGVACKSGSFACVIYGVIPNPAGTFPAVGYAGIDPKTGKPMKSLWDPAVVSNIWNDLTTLRVKYGGL